MQAPSTLSPEQQDALRSAYSFLRQGTTYLEAVQPLVLPEDRPHIDNLLNLGVLALAGLVENFPVVDWER